MIVSHEGRETIDFLVQGDQANTMHIQFLAKPGIVLHIPRQSRHVTDNEDSDLTVPNVLHQLLIGRPVRVGSGVTIIRIVTQIVETIHGCEVGQTAALTTDVLRVRSGGTCV